MRDFVGARIRQKRDSEIRVTLSEWGAGVRVDVRHWFKPDGSSELVPTKKGVSLRLEEVRELLDGIALALTQMDAIEADAGMKREVGRVEGLREDLAGLLASL